MVEIQGIEFETDTDGTTINIPAEAIGKIKGKVKVIIIKEENRVKHKINNRLFLERDEIYERD